MAQRRRGHGEGAIYQRADGRWCASVDLGIINGKRKRKVIYGKTRKEVADKLKALHRDQASGINIAPEQQTIKQFFDQWLEQTIKPHSRPKTYASYAQIARLYLLPHLGSLQLSKLAPEHVQAMLNSLRSTGGEHGGGLAPRTVQYVHAVLRKALNQAVKWGRIPRNVATLIDTPRVEKYPMAPLTPEQGRVLLNAVKGHRLEVLYRVALSLGLRKSEVLGLRWEDADFAVQTLRIAYALQRQSGKLVLVAPKTAASVRTLALPSVLLNALRLHRERQQAERANRGSAWREHGLVFPSNIGTPMEPRNLVRHFKTVLKRAGLPPTIRFHDLRHSCATFLVAQGVHPRVIQEILGHSDIQTTMGIYAHVLPEVQRAAAASIDALFPDQPPADPAASSDTTEPASDELPDHPPDDPVSPSDTTDGDQ
jgi:integrase